MLIIVFIFNVIFKLFFYYGIAIKNVVLLAPNRVSKYFLNLTVS